MILILIPKGVFGNDSNTPIRRFFSISDQAGLSNQSVLSLAQDRNGFIWIGTQDGLNRYDGLHCKTYRWQGEGGLSVSYIHDIQEGPNGKIWISLHEGLFYFDPKTEVFTREIQPDHPAGKTHSELVSCSRFDTDGTLWIGSYNGLLHWDPSTDASTLYFPKPSHDEEESDKSKSIRNICLDDEGKIWIGTFGGLSVLEAENDHYRSVEPQSLIPGLETWSQVFHIRKDKNGILWISTQSNGLLTIDPKTKKGLNIVGSTTQEILKSCSIHGTTEDDDGRIWIATDHGLKCYYPKTQELEHFNHDSFNPFSIGDDIISHAPLIADNILWLPTRYSGVWYTDLSSTFFTPFAKSQGNGLNHALVSSFAEDPDGKLVIATDGGGLNIVDLETMNFEYFQKGDPPFNLPTNKTLAVLIDSKGQYWIGTWNEGLIRHNPETGETQLYRPEKGNSRSLLGLSVFYLIEDHHGAIWVGSWDGGISVYHPETNDFTQYAHDSEAEISFVEVPISHLMEDNQGGIWISSEIGGLNRYDPHSKTLELFKHNETAHSLSSNSLNCAWQDDQGLVWLGTNGAGINVLDYNKKEVIQNPLTQRLSETSVYGILGDRQGFIWLSTNKGLVRYDPHEQKFREFRLKDGIHDDNFGRWAFQKLENGDLLFGGPNGFTWVNTEGSNMEPETPSLLLSGIWRNGQYLFSTINDDLSGSDIARERTVFDKSTKSLRFGFTAPTFRNVDQLHFQFKMDGLDSNWSEADQTRYAQYRNIGYGDYTFRVRVSSGDGQENWQELQFPFKIETPFWLTWYSKSIAILLLIGVVLAIIRWKIYRYHLKEIELENKISERTQDLEESHQLLSEKTTEIENQNRRLKQLNLTKDKMLSIFAHDIKNPFNSVLGFADILHSDYEELTDRERKEYIEYIQIACNDIYNLLDNLLFWSISQEHKIPYHPSSISISKAIDPALKLYETIAKERDIKLEKVVLSEDKSILVDSHLIRMLFRNLLNNALKVTPDGGHITISYQHTDTSVICSISDSGPGMNTEKWRSIRDEKSESQSLEKTPADGTGLGLPLCFEIVELHEGTIKLDSDYKSGCKIIVEIPNGTDS